MRRGLALPLILLFLVASPALARLPLENRLESTPANRALLARLEKALAVTEQRLQAVFGIRPQVVAVAASSPADYGFLLARPNPTKPAVLKINSRVVQDYAPDELRIAAARSLYQTVWPQFRKPVGNGNPLAVRLYEEGMTAYAAELVSPGANPWQYAALFGEAGQEHYDRYLAGEQEVATAVLQAGQGGNEREILARFFPAEGTASGQLLGYRLIQTLKGQMDPKMIQLMGFSEFQARLPGCLKILAAGRRP